MQTFDGYFASGQSNGNGAHCVFPFRHQGYMYFECTATSTTTLQLDQWCSVTKDLDKDGKWGYCKFKGRFTSV